MTVRSRWLLAGGAALLLVAGEAWTGLRAHRPAAISQLPSRTELPRRVTVEVRNATGVPGIARIATIELRHAGLDVVYFDNADGAVEHTEVLVRRGDTTGAGLAVEALGRGVVIAAPDSARMVDLTILVGPDYLKSVSVPRP